MNELIIGKEVFSDPTKFRWATEKLANTRANHWLSQVIPMDEDVAQWKGGKLSADEELIVKRNLGFFVTADSLAANNIVLGTLSHIANHECREFLRRQAYEEVVHTEAYVYIVESLGLDEGEIFNSYHEIPSIRAKDEFLLPFIEVLADPNFKTGTFEADQKLLKSIFAFAAIMEGLFFYVGFVQILSLGRQNKLPGSVLQYRYILRDESTHLNFGMDLINAIKAQQPELWTPQFKQELVDLMEKAVELEYAYAVDTMPRGVLGLNANLFQQYLHFIADRRREQCGLPASGRKTTNPFPWMADMLDLRVENAFFERKGIDYQQGNNLQW